MDRCDQVTLKSVRRMKNLIHASKEINPRPVGVDGITHAGYKDPIGSLRWDPNLLNLSPQLNPLQSLQEDLAFGWIPDATESIRKEGRNLERGTVGNRIVERAISRRLVPLLEKYFNNASYAFRPGKSPQDAVLAARALIRRGYHWAAKTDFEHYFEHVDRGILRQQLRALIADEDLCSAILNAISAILVVRGKSLQRRNGLPEGSGLSPLLSNIYLHGLDQACSDLHYFRYADDVLILGRNKREAEQALQRLQGLAVPLRLKLNMRKKTVRDVYSRPLIFLGYKLCGGNILPPEKAIEKLRNNLQKFRGQPQQGREVMKGFVRRFRIGTVRRSFRRLDRRLLHLYPPGQSLVALLDVMRVCMPAPWGLGKAAIESTQLQPPHGRGCHGD